MPAEIYWQSVVEGTREVLAKAGLGGSEIEGIGLSSQGQTFIPVDREGNALHHAIVWIDNRAQGIVDRWSGTG